MGWMLKFMEADYEFPDEPSYCILKDGKLHCLSGYYSILGALKIKKESITMILVNPVIPTKFTKTHW